ncbi:MAG: cyclic nucleotide-binding domain-containing protein [Candidatus Limnocylindria bacterium]
MDTKSGTGSTELQDTLAGLALFADIPSPELEAIGHTLEERYFGEGERILREGFTGSGFFIILEGEASARVGETEVNRLGRGDFFGEVSVLLGEPPSADVVALRPLRCAVLAAPQLQDFVVAHPRVAYRMLQAEARKLRNATRWRS